MGLMDSIKKTASSVAGEVKEAASAVGSEAGKAGRVAQAQMKLKSLQGDVSDAERELGKAAFGLAETDQLQTPALAEAVAKVREAKAAVAAKEAEIAAIKSEGETAEPGAAPTPPADAPATPAAETTPPPAGTNSGKMPGT